jgi:hypothetical protein
VTETLYRSISAFYRYPGPEHRSATTDFEPAREAAENATTARSRFVISAASLAAAVVGLLGLITGVEALRAVGLSGYLLFGAGAAPWVFARRLDLPLRLVLGTGTSITVLVIASTVMLQTGEWHPTAAAVALLVVTVPVHAAGAFLARYDTPVRPAPFRLAVPATPYLLAGAGTALCLLAALLHRHIDPGIWGFLVRVGPLWYLGLALIAASLVVSRSAEERYLAVGVLLLMLVLTGTPALVYDGPRSQSAAKHVELVEQIRRLHHLRSSVPVYNGWPSFFSAMAWLSDVTGLRDAIHLATAWPALVGTYKLVALRYFAGQVVADRRQVWLAVAFAMLADTIGQDYFSPQSLGLVLAITAFGFAFARRTLRLRHQVALMTVAGIGMSLTHQLTPYIVGGALCVLVIFGRLKPWWTPLTVLGPAVGWALVNWRDLSEFLTLGDIGSSGNFTPPAPGATSGLARLPAFLTFEGGLAGGVVILALLAGATLFRRRREAAAWAVALCPGAGVAIILVHPYGSEGIFRATLFSLPWLAVLAAQVFRRGDTRVGRLSPVVVIAALTTTFILGTFSLDASNVMRAADRTAFAIFADTPTGQGLNYALILGPGDLPSAPTTTPVTHLSVYRSEIDDAGFTLNGAIDQDTVQRLTSELISYSGNESPAGHLFAVWSPVSSDYGREYGLHTAARFAALRDAFQAAAAWKTIYTADGTVLFEYVGIPGVAR